MSMELLARIDAALAEADKLPPPPADPRGKSWNKDTPSGGGPPEGMFSMGAPEVAGMILKSSKSKEQAMSRLSFWSKRAGNMSKDQVHLVKQTRVLIQKSQLPTESIEMGDRLASYFPDVASVIAAAAAYDSWFYFCSSDEESAVDHARSNSDGLAMVVVWCPEYFEYRAGPLDDLPVICTGSSEFEIVTAFDDGAPVDIQPEDLMRDDDMADADNTSDAIDRDHDADAAVTQFVYDPDVDNDNDATPWGDTDGDLWPDARAEGAEIGEKMNYALIRAARAAHVNDRMPWMPLGAQTRRVLRHKGKWLLRHIPKIAAYNARFAKVRGMQERAVVDEALAKAFDETRIKRRRHSARISANRTVDKQKSPERQAASLRMRMWKKRNRHHIKRYKKRYKDPGKIGVAKESVLEAIAEHTGQAVRFSKVGDTRPSLVWPGCSDVVKAVEEKDGFELRTEDCGTPEGQTVTVVSAYTKDTGLYVGDPRFAKYLAKRSIVPEKADPTHNVCSIGWCEKDQRWYGWSHRAIRGFKIGDVQETLEPGGATKGKAITTKDEARAAAIAFADSVS